MVQLVRKYDDLREAHSRKKRKWTSAGAKLPKEHIISDPKVLIHEQEWEGITLQSPFEHYMELRDHNWSFVDYE